MGDNITKGDKVVMHLRGIDGGLKAMFKGWCAIKRISMSKAIQLLMKLAIDKNLDLEKESDSQQRGN